MPAADPIKRQAEILNRLGGGRALADIVARLGRRGVAVTLDRRLRAEDMLRRLAAEGVDLNAGTVLADWLAPLLATSAEEALIVREEAMAACRLRRAETLPQPPDPPRRRPGWQAVAIGLVAVLFVTGLAILIGEWNRGWSTPIAQPGTDAPAAAPVIQDLETVLRDRVLPVLLLLVPLGCIAWRVLRGPRAGTVLRKMAGVGRAFDSLVPPTARTALFTDAVARRAAIALRHPDRSQGRELDVAATIRTTVANGGVPELRWRSQARVREYVLLCERAGAADHAALLAGPLCARLEAAGVNFARYDLDVGHAHVRHAGGRRSGPLLDRMLFMWRRHRGARLMVLGNADSFACRFDGPQGEAELEKLLGRFETPVMLDLTPSDRRGWRQTWLERRGIALFPADERGLEAAASYLAQPAGDREERKAPVLAGEDPLLTQLKADAVRLCSGTRPERREVGLLVRRLRSFVGDGDGLRLLAAIAAFPRISPAITLSLAEAVNGRPLATALAGRLALLPWLRSGRMPDWLRVAILRTLPEDERTLLRERLLQLLARFRSAAADPRRMPDPDGERVDILVAPGAVRQLLSDLGLGGGLVSGEGIFLRFLDGAPPEELDQPIATQRTPPSTRRITAAALIAVLGLGAAIVAGPFLRELNFFFIQERGGNTVSGQINTLFYNIFFASGQFMIVYRLWRRLEQQPAAWIARLEAGGHGLLYVALCMFDVSTMFDYLLAPALVAFHLLFDFSKGRRPPGRGLPAMFQGESIPLFKGSAFRFEYRIQYWGALTKLGLVGGGLSSLVFQFLEISDGGREGILPLALLVAASWALLVQAEHGVGAMHSTIVRGFLARMLLALVAGSAIAPLIPTIILLDEFTAGSKWECATILCAGLLLRRGLLIASIIFIASYLWMQPLTQANILWIFAAHMIASMIAAVAALLATGPFFTLITLLRNVLKWIFITKLSNLRLQSRMAWKDPPSTGSKAEAAK